MSGLVEDAQVGPLAPARRVHSSALSLVGRISLISGGTAAAGVVFLGAMAVSFAMAETSLALAFGRVNDVLVLVAYLLVIPSVLAVGWLLRPMAPLWALVSTLIGLGAASAIVILQALLVIGALAFQEQVGMVSIALLVLGGWFVGVGYLARSRGILPHGVRMGLLAATYIGYPVWAIWMGRRLIAVGVAGRPQREAFIVRG